MGQYLIDNNVISSFFSGAYAASGMEFVSAAIDARVNLSVITEIEALSWLCSDKSKEKIIENFVADSDIINLSPAIVASCIALRRSRKIRTPDAIIAATAITHSLTLLTSDRAFKNIEGLKIIDPFTL